MAKNTSTFNNTVKDFELIRKYIHSLFLNPSRSKADFEEIFEIKSSSFRDMIARLQNFMDGAHLETHNLSGKTGKDNKCAYHLVGNPFNSPVHYLADIFSNASYSLPELQFYFAFLMAFSEISTNEDESFTYVDVIDAMNSRVERSMISQGLDTIEDYFQSILSSSNTQKVYWNRYIQQGYIIPVQNDTHSSLAWHEKEYILSKSFDEISDEDLLNKLYLLVVFFYHETSFCVPGYNLSKSLSEYISSSFNDKEEINSFHIAQKNPYFQFEKCSRQSVIENDVLWRLFECIDEVKPIKFLYSTPNKSYPITILPTKIVQSDTDGRLYIWCYHYFLKKFYFYRIDRLSYPTLPTIVKDNWFNIAELNGEKNVSEIKRLLSEIYNEYTKYLWNINNSGLTQPHEILVHFSFPKERFSFYISRLNREKKHGIVTNLGDNIHADFSILLTDTYTDGKFIPKSIVPWLRSYEGMFFVDHDVCPDLADYMENTPFYNTSNKIVSQPDYSKQFKYTKDADFTNISLFNEFCNKDFLWLRNYVNTSCYYEDYLDENAYLSEDEIKRELSGSSTKAREKRTAQETIDAVLNHNNECKENLYVLAEKDGQYIPLSFYSANEERRLPILISKAEKTWLNYALNDPKAKLFLSSEEIETVREIFDDGINLIPIEKHLQTFGTTSQKTYSDAFISNFNLILEAIKSSKYIRVTNNTSRGPITNKFVPNKIIYNGFWDLFSVTFYSPEEDRPVKATLNKLSDIKILEPVTDTDAERAINAFSKKHSDEPIVIEINNATNAYDKAAFLFADNDTYAEQSAENEAIYRLYIDFYSSEKKDILAKIKSLGQYATIISCPEDQVTP